MLEENKSDINERIAILEFELRQANEREAKIRRSLSFQLGNVLTKLARSPLGWLKMPVAMMRIVLRHKRGFLVSGTSSYKVRNVAAEETKVRERNRRKLLLGANAKLDSPESWLSNVNSFLETFNSNGISLAFDGDRFSSLRGKCDYVIEGGPLVSIIMAAYNSENTIEHAVRSIINQTWSNIELVVVDDCSTDGTFAILRRLSQEDSRIKICRNIVNVGPFASKNAALGYASGKYITGQDADDWSHPQRIEHHVENMLKAPSVKASVGKKVRLSFSGHILLPQSETADVATPAFISCMFDAEYFHKFIGHWDSVRFGGDSEIMGRIARAQSEKIKVLDLFTMFCLDSEDGLTNHKEHGISKGAGLSPVRRKYRESYTSWHSGLSREKCRLDFPLIDRPFDVADELYVPKEAVIKNLEFHQVDLRCE